MDPEDPFVTGINMQDLRNVISNSKNKANVLMFFDCCYAGVATRDQIRGGSSRTSTVQQNPTTRNLLFNQVKNIVDSPDPEGRGKVILASSEATAVSREKNNCK